MKKITKHTLELAEQLKDKKLSKVEKQIVGLFENDDRYQLQLDDNGNICATLIKQ